MKSAAPIPDRRRTRFPRNGGPRLTDTDRKTGRRGIEAARNALDANPARAPLDPRIQKQLTTEQIRRARTGIAAARAALP